MEHCRVCLKDSDSHESFTAEYREQFFQITSVYIDESEREFICPGCLKRLLHAHELRLEAIKADLWFRERLFSKQRSLHVTKTVKVIKKCAKRRAGKSKAKRKTQEISVKSECDGVAPVVLFPQITPENDFYICDVCDRKFNKKREIIQHMQEEHISREFICPEDECGKQFSLLRSYRKHLHTHSPNSPEAKWICEYCAKCFNTKYKLTLHSRSHTNVRPYQCSQCPASFKQKTDLNSHLMSLHSDDRPFLCKDCGLSFKIPNSLRSHRKRKHHQNGMKTCSECHKKLMCSAELKEHMVSRFSYSFGKYLLKSGIVTGDLPSWRTKSRV